ncbi:MAG: glycosyltransferase [Nitrospirota bacterium]|nr:glycosyltransferase [Nitrospirota bacterium]
MKILFITPLYEPAWKAGGGVLSFLSTLCRALARQGISVTVYTTNASGADEPLDVQPDRPVDLGGVKVFYFRSTFGPKNLFYSSGLIKKLRHTARDFDVVYIAAWFMWTGIRAAAVCHRMNVPIIAGIHGGFSEHSRRKSYFKKKLFRELFIRRALMRAAAIRVTCEKERTDAGSWLEGLTPLILPTAVDPEKYYALPENRETFRKKHRIPNDAPVLISVARPDWMKRIDLLIGAIAKTDNWYLIFAGAHDSGKGPEWKRYAEKLGVADRIIWTGFLHGDELNSALSSSDLFALVSESENFCMVVVEAMLCGLPVMVSKDMGVREFIKDQPFTFTAERTADSVYESIRKFEEQRSGICGDTAIIRQFAARTFSPESIARHFVSELEKLIPSNTAGNILC